MRKRVLIFLILSCYSLQLDAQKRIALDVNYRNANLSFSSTYHHVVKSNWLFSVGVFGGGKGKTLVVNSMDEFNSGNSLQSPWRQTNQPQIHDSVAYDLFDYDANSSSFGIHFGVGYFHSFGAIHGIRGHLFSQFGYGYNKVFAKYYAEELQLFVMQRLQENHFIAAITPEIYHTINLKSRFTLYYGCKLPYYFSIDKQSFNPQNKKDPFYRLRPELTLGITVLVGKCD